MDLQDRDHMVNITTPYYAGRRDQIPSAKLLACQQMSPPRFVAFLVIGEAQHSPRVLAVSTVVRGASSTARSSSNRAEHAKLNDSISLTFCPGRAATSRLVQLDVALTIQSSLEAGVIVMMMSMIDVCKSIRSSQLQHALQHQESTIPHMGWFSRN